VVRDIWSRIKPVARQNRQAPTDAEARLWDSLRGSRLEGLRFRRQHAIDPFIVDFYCARAKLVIEVDGPIHRSSVEQDQARQEDLNRRGLTVIRFSNEEVMNSIDSVVDRIGRAARARLRERAAEK
jgi:very-short-patch-repair endonuclease